MAVSPWGYDPDYIHCYPVSFPGAGALDPPPLDSCTTDHPRGALWLAAAVQEHHNRQLLELPGSNMLTGPLLYHTQLIDVP